MAIIALILLAIGLSMDSLIIALTSGTVIKNHSTINILKIAGMLAFMQMTLTILGWFLGISFVRYIDKYDHWLAFGILTFLGLRVIYSCIKNEEDEEVRAFNPLNFKTMVGLALITSIDAMAVGLSLSLVNEAIVTPAIVIGVVTFMMSSCGIIFGSKIGQKFNNSINLIGGIILILIASSILAKHTVFAEKGSIASTYTSSI